MAVSIIGFFLAPASPVGASHQYNLVFEPSEATPGQEVAAHFHLLPPDMQVELRWQSCEGLLLGTGAADAEGMADLEFIVPSDSSPGDVEIWACQMSPLTDEPRAFRVLPPPPLVVDPGGPYAGIVGVELELNGSESTGPITAYEWNFGDGTIGSGPVVTHIYKTPGVFNVVLAVFDASGRANRAGTQAIVTPNMPPVAVSGGPYIGTAGKPVAFDASQSRDEDGTIVAYEWDFGDGGVADAPDPIHTYATQGVYVAMLTVTDNLGLQDNVAVEVTVRPINTPPIAASGGVYEGVAGSDVSFDGGGSFDSDGTIVAFRWDFGDGAVSTEPAPSHAYVEAGEYEVTLTVTDDDGAIDTVATIASIRSHTGCAIEPGSFTVTPESGPPGTRATVTVVGRVEPCEVRLDLGGVSVGEPFTLRPGTAGSTDFEVPGGIQQGETSLELLTTDGRSLDSIQFQVEGAPVGLPAALAGGAAALFAAWWLFKRRSSNLVPRPQGASGPPPWTDSSVGAVVQFEAPAAVRAGEPFDLRLVVEGEFNGSCGLEVQVSADGFALPEGTRYRVDAPPSAGGATVVRAIAGEVDGVKERRIVAHVSWEGHIVGWTQAVVTIVPPEATPAPGAAPVTAVVLGTPDGPPPDLTLTITRAAQDRYLEWGFESPHPVVLPTQPVRVVLPVDDARAYAYERILSIAEADPVLMPLLLRGTADEIGSKIPSEAWEALRAVMPYARNADHATMLLLISEETFIPWELAAVPEDIGGGVLGRETALGRWVPPNPADGLRPEHPVLPPPATLQVRAMGVVFHAAAGEGVAALPFALEESSYLAGKYGAEQIPATAEAVAALLGPGGGSLDAIHFACHGDVQPGEPIRSGIAVWGSSGRYAAITDTMLRGSQMLRHARPLLVINACESGTPQEGLDRFGGVVAASLRSGARAVVAPLWRVFDREALEVAKLFYNEIYDQHVNVGEAMRRIRIRSYGDNRIDPTFLAYVYFGHPCLQVTRVAE